MEPLIIWWKRLGVQAKVWTILLIVFIPLVSALILHVYLADQLQAYQQQHQQVVLAREQIQVLRRLAVDIEDAFRGYLLTRQDKFLGPLDEAAPKVQPTVERVLSLVAGVPEIEEAVRSASHRLETLLESKRRLIKHIQSNHVQEVLDYVRSGQGIALSDAVRNDLRLIEDALARQLRGTEVKEARLARLAFWGLLLAVVGTLALGLLLSRLISRSITRPLVRLQESVGRLGSAAKVHGADTAASRTSDEIEQLAQGFEEMAGLIRMYLRELETLIAIGHEINTIGADGSQGVLRRITDRAVELLQADVCLIMLRNEQTGCWIVEAASGTWHDRLYKTVMLWEEFPASVQAFETGQPAIGENFRNDLRSEMIRRNVIGESMLAVPLLSQGVPFGVLVLLQNQAVTQDAWNVRLAKGFADEAATAIANARLYEAEQQKEQGLTSRLRQLEHLAETLAHDMKAPGERIGEMATILLTKYGDHLNEQAKRWLRLIDTEGKELSARVENIIEVARVGVRPGALEMVDPVSVIEDVLKQRAGDLARRRVRVLVGTDAPMVACHRAYLWQVFDNLISNSVKFMEGCPDPQIHVTARREGGHVNFSISDNGPGILPPYRTRVFEPFVRLRPDSTKGSGIGLTIVKRIVEMYGGGVWIESTELPGCTVTFTLPAVADFSDLPGTSVPNHPAANERDGG